MPTHSLVISTFLHFDDAIYIGIIGIAKLSLMAATKYKPKSGLIDWFLYVY